MDYNAENYFENLVNNKKGNSKSMPDQEVDAYADNIPIASLAKSENIHVHTSKANKVESELDFFDDDFDGEPEGQLTVDVFQTPDDIVIQSTVAGVNQDDLDIDITGESVSIKGKRHRSEETHDDDFFYQECYWGRFSRSIILPQEINPDKAKATLKDGVLTLRLPKLTKEKRKKLRVKIT